MGVQASEVGYTIATTRRETTKSSYEHVVALEKKIPSCSNKVLLDGWR